MYAEYVTGKNAESEEDSLGSKIQKMLPSITHNLSGFML